MKKFEMYNLIDLLAAPSGRASLRHWWAAFVAYVGGVNLVFFLLQGNESLLIGLVGFLFCLACIGGYFVISIRRLHDQNKSGAWLLIYFVPFVGALILFVLLGFIAGDKEKNSYGKPFHLRNLPPDRTVSDQYT